MLYSCGLPEVHEAEPVLNHVKLNQAVSLALEEDHSRGETWQLVKDVNSEAFENLGSTWKGSKKGVRFNLKPLKSGIYRLTFKKTVMGDSAGSRSFLLRVDAR